MSDNFIQDVIKRLSLENEQLKLQNEQLNSAINDLYGNVSTLVGMVKANMDAVTSCGNAVNQLQGYISMVENIAHNTKYEICDILGQNIFFKPKFRSNEETLHLIIDEGKSLARFGDGEFSIAGNLIRHKFQKLDEKLAARIKQVLVCQNDNLLVAIADNYGSLEKYTEDAADAIHHEDYKKFLELVNESGTSSWELLQNCYTMKDFHEQKITRTLALTQLFLKKIGAGVCRVHGGGFAGVIAAIVPEKEQDNYVEYISRFVGRENVYPMDIRAVGAAHIG